MFEGGKGVYAEGFGTLDEHRVSFEPESSNLNQVFTSNLINKPSPKHLRA